MKKAVTSPERPRSGVIHDDTPSRAQPLEDEDDLPQDGADAETGPQEDETPPAKAPYRPWKSDFSDGLMMLAGGVATAAILVHAGVFPNWHHLQSLPNLIGAIGSLVALFGAARIKRGMVRSRGKSVERRAAQSVRKRVPKSVSVEESVMLPGWGGDADILVTDTRSGRRWCVEVKSQTMVQMRRGLFTKGALLYNPVSRRGNFNPRKAIAQARAVAAKFGAEPVLWFPAAARMQPSSYGTLDGVLIVCGPAKLLLRRAKIPSKGLFG